MRYLGNYSTDELMRAATELGILTDHQQMDRFLYLEIAGRRYVFDLDLARIFLMGALSNDVKRVPLQPLEEAVWSEYVEKME